MEIGELIKQLTELQTELRQINPDVETQVRLEHYDRDDNADYYSILEKINVTGLVNGVIGIVLV